MVSNAPFVRGSSALTGSINNAWSSRHAREDSRRIIGVALESENGAVSRTSDASRARHLDAARVDAAIGLKPPRSPFRQAHPINSRLDCNRARCVSGRRPLTAPSSPERPRRIPMPPPRNISGTSGAADTGASERLPANRGRRATAGLAGSHSASRPARHRADGRSRSISAFARRGEILPEEIVRHELRAQVFDAVQRQRQFGQCGITIPKRGLGI